METQIRPGHQREKERGTDSLVVVLDEMNKEQDIFSDIRKNNSDDNIRL